MVRKKYLNSKGAVENMKTSREVIKILRVYIDDSGKAVRCSMEHLKNNFEATPAEVWLLKEKGHYIDGLRIKNDDIRVEFRGKANLEGSKIEEWYVDSYLGSGYWSCICSCGKIKAVHGNSLKHGLSRSCGHGTVGFIDISGKQFGDWKVLEYDKEKRLWKCECQCENKTIGYIASKDLRDGQSKSCGHAKSNLRYLEGKKVHDWTFIKYLGIDKNKHMYLARCGCGREKTVCAWLVLNGSSYNCGDCDRDDWQIETVQNMEKFNAFLTRKTIELNRQPYLEEISEWLGYNKEYIRQVADKFNARQFIQKSKADSQIEYQLRCFLDTLSVEYIAHCRKEIYPLELDVYYPDKKIAIEMNGDYWHSDSIKDKRYHIDKTIACNDKGIRLIHINEYEWNNRNTREKLMAFLKKEIVGSVRTVYARQCEVKIIDNRVAYEAIEKWHLQGSTHW